MKDTRTEIQKIHDLWREGRLVIEFRPLLVSSTFIQKCASAFTKRTGKVNLLGSVQEIFRDVVPFVIEMAEKEKEEHENG